MPAKKPVMLGLVIDGGEVRGIISGRILQAIEESHRGWHIGQKFALLGGVSSGAIQAGTMAMPNPFDPGMPMYSARRMTDGYHRASPRIFPPEKSIKPQQYFSSQPFYDIGVLRDKVLKPTFGDTLMKDALTKLVIGATSIESLRPIWMSSYTGEWQDKKMMDAALASAAAPILLGPSDGKLDGQFSMASLMHHVRVELRKMAGPDTTIGLVYVGTGRFNHGMSEEEYRKCSPVDIIKNPRYRSFYHSLIFEPDIAGAREALRAELGDLFFDLSIDMDAKARGAPSAQFGNASNSNMERLEATAQKAIAGDIASELSRLVDVMEHGVTVGPLPVPMQEQKRLSHVWRDFKEVTGNAVKRLPVPDVKTVAAGLRGIFQERQERYTPSLAHVPVSTTPKIPGSGK